MTWCVVQTESRREPLVKLLLAKKAPNEIYLPRIRFRGRKMTMFPGYIFVKLIADQWYGVRWTPHVIHVILDARSELEGIVGELRRRERDGFVRLPRVSRLQVGQPVRIISGSFEGQTGWYDGQTSHDRVRVLLEMIGRKVPVELSERDLSATHNSLRPVVG